MSIGLFAPKVRANFGLRNPTFYNLSTETGAELYFFLKEECRQDVYLWQRLKLTRG